MKTKRFPNRPSGRQTWQSCTFIALVTLALVCGLLFQTATRAARADAPPVFTNVTTSAGVSYLDETWGWAWGDYNGDGWLDLFLANHPILTEFGTDLRPSWLMHNNQDGTFSEVLASSGISEAEDRHDIAWIDYDNDGDLDLWITVGGRGGVGDGPSELFRNDGDTFVNVAAEAGVDYPKGRGRGSAWLDYDLDGDMDMFFTGAEREDAPNAFFRNNGDGTFTNITSQLTLDPYLGAMSQVSVADYDQDGDPDMYVTGQSTRLYRNDGGQFTRAETTAGVYTVGANAPVWGDYDNDGDLDLFVSRGAQDLNSDYEEFAEGEIRFAGRVNSGDEDGIDFTLTTPGTVSFLLQEQIGGLIYRRTSAIYIGPDGANPPSNPFTLTEEDLGDRPTGSAEGYYIWQSTPGVWHIRWRTDVSFPNYRYTGVITPSGPLTTLAEVGFEDPNIARLPDMLYRNNGNGTFTEVGTAAGVATAEDCRGADWGDFDNDGFLDLYVQTAGDYGNNAPDVLYHNNGDGTFSEMASAAAIDGTLDGYGWGGGWGDYDNDGFLDLLTHHESWPWPLDKGRYELFHNEGNANHWLQLELQGITGHPDAYGAKVRLTAGGVTQFREINDTSHYFYHYTGPLNFGLGANLVADQIEIAWPGGAVTLLTNVPADQRLVVIEGEQPTPTDTSEPPTPTDTEVIPTPTDTLEPPTPTDTEIIPTPTDTPEPPTPTDTDVPPTPTDTLEPPTPTDTSEPPTATPTPFAEEVIIDNLDAGFSTTGTWRTHSQTSLLHYGDDFAYASPGGGTKTALFTPNLQAGGLYEVYIWFPRCWVCSTAAPYTIYYAGGSLVITVNQNDRNLAGQWVSLGTFFFEPGTGSIMLTNASDGRVSADAVRLAPR